MFKFCPSCGSREIAFERGKVFKCPDCGFSYYHNIAAATGCIIDSGGRVALLVRGKDPCKGKLDLPGGFVDLGEGALEGLRREIREELGWTPPGEEAFTFFASFANVYPYKNIVYNTCDLFFTLSAPGLPEKDLVLEAKEIAGVEFLWPGEIDPGRIAFDSARRALTAYRDFPRPKTGS
jgi:8-oxo-dGTP pyrophosphatase MutT (NUDIX family)